MLDKLEELLRSAVSEVLGTMFGVRPVVEPAHLQSIGEPQIAAGVGLIGSWTGIVYLYCSTQLARDLARKMVGVPEQEQQWDDLINDTMGELGSMVVGHMKTQLSMEGRPCVLTIPSIIRGSHFCIEATSEISRRLIGFRCGRYPLVAEIMLKPTKKTKD